MIKPVKSTSEPPQSGVAPKARAKSAKAAAVDAGVMEFDFGGARPTSIVQPESEAIAAPPEPTPVEKKEVPVAAEEPKLRIQHTTRPDPTAPPSQPLPHIAAAQKTRSKFSIDSIKITDLTGELGDPAPVSDATTKSESVPVVNTTAPVETKTPAVSKSVDPVVEPVTKKEHAPITTASTLATDTSPAPAPASPLAAGMPASITSEKKTVTPEKKTAPVTLKPAASAPASSTSATTATSIYSKHTTTPVTKTTAPTTTVSPTTSSAAKTTETKPVASSPSPTPAAATATETPSHTTTKTHHTTKENHSTPTTTRNTTMALNQPSISDFRKNAERQAKEQHAVSNVLVWIGYGLIGAVILFVVLAALGGYTLKQMIDSQSVSIAQLDNKYSEQLAKNTADTEQLREQVSKLSDQLAAAANLMAKQQEQLKRTAASADDSAAILKARTREISDLRDRVRRLEGPRGGR